MMDGFTDNHNDNPYTNSPRGNELATILLGSLSNNNNHNNDNVNSSESRIQSPNNKRRRAPLNPTRSSTRKTKGINNSINESHEPVSDSDSNNNSVSSATTPTLKTKRKFVISAHKVETNDSMTTTNVETIQYNNHSIRIIRLCKGILEKRFVHASDIGSIVERKSNISRMFGQFESPREKLLMTVTGRHNNKIGQEANVLTVEGVKRMMKLKKCRTDIHFVEWLQTHLIPLLQQKNTNLQQNHNNSSNSTLYDLAQEFSEEDWNNADNEMQTDNKSEYDETMEENGSNNNNSNSNTTNSNTNSQRTTPSSAHTSPNYSHSRPAPIHTENVPHLSLSATPHSPLDVLSAALLAEAEHHSGT